MIHLHNYSTYSFLQAYGLPSQLVAQCQANRQKAIALTDRAGITGLVPFYKECKKAGIKAILGSEIFLVKTLEGEGKKAPKHSLVLLAKNKEGYTQLSKIITKSNLDGFYYQPTADYQILQEHSEHLIALSGGIEGIIPRMLNQNDFDKVVEWAKIYKKIFGEDFYLEITPHQSMPVKKIVELGKLLDIRVVVTCNTIFPSQTDFEAFKVIDCIGKKMKMNEYLSRSFDERNGIRYQMTEQELKQTLKPFLSAAEIEEAIANTHHVAAKIVPELPKASSLKFKGVNKEKLLKEVIQKGWRMRGLHKLSAEKQTEYKKRLQKEWKLIVEKDYVDYFLIVQDLVNWAKDNGIMVGHARGSAAGSLICWLARITEIDPIPHGLIFERFIDINRFDPPDIDIDFEDTRREEVKAYLSKKYGKDKVASIGTIMYYKGRISFDDLGRIYSIPPQDLVALKDLIIERTGGDSRASFTIQDTLKQFPAAQETIKKYPQLEMASQLEAQARQKGIHAAGVIIGNDKIENYLPISFRKGIMVADVDKKIAEEMGFLKLDLLGLNYLSILTKARKLLKARKGIDIDYYNLPTDDKAVYKNFQRGKLFGVFQFEGEAVNAICRQVMPSNFKELVDISALSRPGALNSGGTASYVKHKKNPEEVEYAHPLIKELAEDTYGTIIYQEQVMTIMRQMGNMSWEDTSEIRRLISKTMGEEYFNTFKIKFMKGAVEENGVPEEIAEEVWSNVCTFGAFAFNKSHTVSYSYISYACMYMKTNYPLEYYACLCEDAMEWKLNKIVREFKKEGGKMLLPNVNKSKLSFTIEGDAIRAGFQNIKGIGAATADKIIKNQPYHDIEEFKRKTKVSKKIVETLKCLGALNDLEQRTQSLFGDSWLESFHHEPTINDLIKYFPYGADLDLIGNLKEKITEQVGYEPEMITIEEIIESKPKGDVTTVVQITKRDLRNIYEVGKVKANMRNPELEDYMHLTIDDGTGFLKAIVNRFEYPGMKKDLWDENYLKKEQIFLIQGKYDKAMEILFVNCLKPIV